MECYTKGMEADATNVLLAANRAMAYLKLERCVFVSLWISKKNKKKTTHIAQLYQNSIIINSLDFYSHYISSLM